MKNLLSIGAIAAITTLGVAGAGAVELPAYELIGFPITPHQFSVVGSASIKERSPNTSLMMAGMPASPHQIAVLTAHRRPIEELAAANGLFDRP
jgi:hypothetical protein